MRSKTMLAIFRILVASAILGSAAPSAFGAFELELVAEVPPTADITPDWIEGIQVLDADPNQIIFTTQNVGAYCGGGTPVAAWKLTLDPNTGEAQSVELKQLLSQIQMIRNALFESSGGTLFTGGGWCGAKPPYVSTDGGETWRAATIGQHPPNSTFSFVEFHGETYAGTGYAPYHAQVYRWLGGPPDDWELVFDVAPPRTIIASMATYHDRLFISTHVYWYDGCNSCEGTVPVYVSDDGVSFEPTTGIPSCHTLGHHSLLVVGDELLARTHPCGDSDDLYLYRWNEMLDEWELHTPLEVKRYRGLRDLVAYQGVLYAYGQRTGDPWGIYASTDLGLTWALIAELSDPHSACMEMHGGIIYIGTERDVSDTAYIYRLRLAAPLDIKPQSCPNPLNTRSRGVLPVAILGTEDFDVTSVDPTTVTLIGVSPLRWAYEDVTAPVSPGGDVCDCIEDGPDGYMDLTLKFDTQEIVAALGAVTDGELKPLTLTGQTYDGIPVHGEDCVWIKDKDNDPDPPPVISVETFTGVSSTVGFSLGEPTHVTMVIYDVQGKRVRTVVDGVLPSGDHRITWDGRDENNRSVANGVYFCWLKAEDLDETVKLVLMK